MPFVRVNIDEVIENECQNDPAFKKVWEESREEYRLLGEMIALRRKENVTQRDLAKMIGSKQQVISRIEKRECRPSLRSFCNILSALGYELQIVKKTEK